jgi:hypothetical protein
MTLEELLPRFPSAKRAGSGYLVTCPNHEDDTASLSLGRGEDGRILAHCHAGCAVEDVASRLGLKVADFFVDTSRETVTVFKPRARIVETYPYRDEGGAVLYETVRYEPKDFKQRRPNGYGGWIWSLKNEQKADAVRFVLYRLPEIQGHSRLVIAEGEKDANRLVACGIDATTSPLGAGKWRPDYTTQLCAAGVTHVILVPHNDDAGRHHADQIAASCVAAGLEVTVVTLPGLALKGDAFDYLAAHTADDFRRCCQTAPAWTSPVLPPAVIPIRDFRMVHEGRYTLGIGPPGIQFTIDRLRRERYELIGELTVHCDLDGARRTPTGTVLTADFNLSSARARTERAKLLAERAQTGQSVDWMGYLEEFCEGVFAAQRNGAPDVVLAEAPKPTADRYYHVSAIQLPCDHPAIVFGDGGTAKSYLALAWATELARQGVRVLYADWELTIGDHRERFERLTTPMPTTLRYIRCENPMVDEADRLRRIIAERPIDYLICDSIGFACDGPPEESHAALGYWRAVRRLGIGSLHLAHMAGAEGSDKKPFGSRFWGNASRTTWYVERAEDDDPGTMTLGLFERKNTFGPGRRSQGVRVHFTEGVTRIECCSLAGKDNLVKKQHVADRMVGALRAVQGRPMLPKVLAEETGDKEETVKRKARDLRKLFVLLPNPSGGEKLIGLAGL